MAREWGPVDEFVRKYGLKHGHTFGELTPGDLLAAMNRLREFMAWAVKRHTDPWAVRQALLMVLHASTSAALECGFLQEDLDRFDSQVTKNLEEWDRQARLELEAKGKGGSGYP